MFIKTIGSVFIIFSCAAYGFAKGREYKRHIDELDELRRIASMFATETLYTRLPICELSVRISKKVEDPYKSWLIHLSQSLNKETQKTLIEIWKNEAEKLIEQLLLTQNEIDDLKNLGTQLGNLNLQMQENAFRWYAAQLEEQRMKLAKEVSEKQRLCNSLGILTGIFLTILFI